MLSQQFAVLFQIIIAITAIKFGFDHVSSLEWKIQGMDTVEKRLAYTLQLLTFSAATVVVAVGQVGMYFCNKCCI